MRDYDKSTIARRGIYCTVGANSIPVGGMDGCKGAFRPTNPDPITVIKIYRGTPWCGYLRVPRKGGSLSPKFDENVANNPRNPREKFEKFCSRFDIIIRGK